MRTMTAPSLVLLLACAHAKQVEDPSRAPAAEADDEEPTAAPAQEQVSEPGEKATAPKQGRVAGGAEDPSEIPVASSPSGLLKPGAEQSVRDKLVAKKGGSLRAALQKFQKEHDLPATGILDQRTVESLGLDPDDVFERADAR